VIRPYKELNPLSVKQLSYLFPAGTTKVLKTEVVQKFASEGKKVEVVSEQVATDAMQLD
jgi:Proteasome beta subunits C terminal